MTNLALDSLSSTASSFSFQGVTECCDPQEYAFSSPKAPCRSGPWPRCITRPSTRNSTRPSSVDVARSAPAMLVSLMAPCGPLYFARRPCEKHRGHGPLLQVRSLDGRVIYRTVVHEPWVGPGNMYQPLPQYLELSRTSPDRLALVAGSVQGPYTFVRTHGTKSPSSSPISIMIRWVFAMWFRLAIFARSQPRSPDNRTCSASVSIPSSSISWIVDCRFGQGSEFPSIDPQDRLVTKNVSTPAFLAAAINSTAPGTGSEICSSFHFSRFECENGRSNAI